MKPMQVWRLVLTFLIVLGFSAFGQDKSQVNEMIWSRVYWQKMAEKGLVPVNPQTTVKPGQYTGSQISALSSLVDDSPDVLIVGGNNTQSENSIFVNPNDPSKVLNSNNSTDLPVSTVYGTSGFMTTDGGLTWTGSVQGTGGPNSGDPAAVIGLNGEYYVGYIADNGGNGMAYSTDEGANWVHVQVAPPPADPFGLLDKNHLWVDNSPSSPHQGNLYAAWTRFDTGHPNDGKVEVATSTDGGRTWSAPVGVSNGLTGFHQGVNIKTSSDGTVYAFYTVYTSGGVSDEPAMGMSVSTDGGVTWTSGTIIIDNIRGVRVTGVGKGGIRAASFPSAAIDISGGPRDGELYVVWPNIGVPGVNTGTDIDVYLIKSNDGGTTWSTPTRVNQDPAGLGKKHFHPWITSDPVTGNLSVIFYDDRNVGSTDVEVFVANSLDGGTTWEDFKVSDVSFTPSPIPGLAGGYFGDYIGISSYSAKVYPVWTDNRDGVARAYVSPFVLADPEDPNPPANVAAYSDFTTPNSIELTWDDPTTLVNGTPIASGDFAIDIVRDGAPLISVAGGIGSYTDTSLNDGQRYEYELTTRLLANDSTSTTINVGWHAGGSPIPGTPQNLSVTADTVSATLTWVDPVVQADGTPLDDLDSIRVYRNGNYVASVAAGVQSYTDMPTPGFTYTYTVRAVDNETPKNISAPSNSVEIYVGSTPDFLVWVGPTAGSSAVASGDSLAMALAANGESVFLTNDLFEFGTDLSIYEGIFVVLGIYSNNHVIDETDPEGPALEAYAQNGGYLYVEGGDCFNWDPDVGGYDIRPWFDLNDGPDGSADVAGVLGVNDLNGFVFPYSGENNFMDQLQPINSVKIWLNDVTDSTHGVYNTTFGTGRTIGVVPEFGGLIDTTLSPAEMLRFLERRRERAIVNDQTVKVPVERKRNENFVKKYYPAQKVERRNQETFRFTDKGVQILGNNKVDLMAAYLDMFRAQPTDPVMSVDPVIITDTLLVNGSKVSTFKVRNAGGSLASPLNFNITLTGLAGWLTFSPSSGTLTANQSATISVALDATGLTAGTYTAQLAVTGNDPITPQVNVDVTLIVNDSPIVGFFPDSMAFTLDPATQDSAEMLILNTGAGQLVFDLEPTIGAGTTLKRGKAKVPSALISDELRAEMARRDATRTDMTAEQEISIKAPQGNPILPMRINGEEIFGSTASSFSGSNRDRGNIFSVTTTTTLLEYKQYLNIPTDVELYFFVYEGDAPTGDFTLKNVVYVPNSGTGEGFYSSGPTNVLLEAGKSYYLGAAWGGVSVTYYRGTESVPITASFGTLQSGVPSTSAGFPPNNGTINLTWTGFSPYYCAVTTGAGFLSVAPPSGSVQPGDTARATVYVNSDNLLGGTYQGGIKIISNDPVTPDTTMPVTLTVTGVPKIDVTPDTLQFTELFVGQSETMAIEVANIGSSDLTVSNITSTDPVFSADPTSLVIPPLSSEMVDVTFTPTASGLYQAFLEVASDDPSAPLDTVVLLASALDPPIASISPDSFDVTLAIGDIATDTLTITNSGNSPLDFTIDIDYSKNKNGNVKVEFLGGAKQNSDKILARGRALPLAMLSQTQFAVALNASGEPDFEAPFTLNKTTNKSGSMSVQGEEIFGSNQNSFGPGGVRGRGNLFTCTTTTNLAEHRFYLNPTVATKMYFVVAESDAQVGTYTTISVAEVLNAGPGEGWYSSGTVNVTLQAGKYYLIFAQWVDAATYYNEQNISPYPIPASFGELTAGAGWSAGSTPTYSDPPSATHQISATAFGAPVAYYQALVTGGGGNWLSTDTTSGTVPPNSEAKVAVTFDPSGLVGGDYNAEIVVSTNDPANPVLTSHAHMFVVGQPQVAADSVVFPNPVFVNGLDSTKMVVKNVGNGVLNVTDIVSDTIVFSVAPTAFDVAAFDSAEVTVYFQPVAAGSFNGTLTISSNDPVNPTLAVNVSGTAVDAPLFSIDPDTVSKSLTFDDSVDVPMLIENSGGSPLNWSVQIKLGNSKNVYPALRLNASNAGEIEAASDRTPGLAELNTPQRVMDTIWDMQFEYDIETASGAPGNAGSEFDGQYFYSTRWASNLIHKYEVDASGNFQLVEEFSIPGVTGLRDLAWDGQYMYGGNAGNTIYQMDFTTKQVIGTISSPQPVRHIAYDSDLDAFYVGNWSTNIALVDRNGNVLNTIPAATHGGLAVYGSAYDNFSPGGPYLWIFDQTTTTTTTQGPNVLKQLSLPSGTPTGVEYDVIPDLGNGVDISLAGGLFITDEIVPGKVTIGGTIQGGPDRIFGYELADAAPPFISIIDFTSGVIDPGDVGGFTVRLYSFDKDTVYNASLEITTNDPLNQLVVVPVTLQVGPTGVEELETVPTTFAVSPNYPNPFNPTTSIDFQLPQTSNVKLVIYNVLGQKVRTLVNERMQPGRYKATWDARNDMGAPVASGIYIYRFEAGNFNSIQKMILLK